MSNYPDQLNTRAMTLLGQTAGTFAPTGVSYGTQAKPSGSENTNIKSANDSFVKFSASLVNQAFAFGNFSTTAGSAVSSVLGNNKACFIRRVVILKAFTTAGVITLVTCDASGTKKIIELAVNTTALSLGLLVGQFAQLDLPVQNGFFLTIDQAIDCSVYYDVLPPTT